MSTPVSNLHTPPEVVRHLADCIRQNNYRVEVTVSDREEPVIRLLLLTDTIPGGFVIVALSSWLKYAVLSWRDDFESSPSAYGADITTWYPMNIQEKDA